MEEKERRERKVVRKCEWGKGITAKEKVKEEQGKDLDEG